MYQHVQYFQILPTQCDHMIHMVPEDAALPVWFFWMDSEFVSCAVPNESYSVSFLSSKG